MNESEKIKVIKDIISFYALFQKEVMDIFPDNCSELSHQLSKALLEIYYYPEITPSILSKRLAITIQNTSRCLHKLTELGYITRAKDENDKRINHIRLSAKGLDFVENSIRHMDELMIKKLSVLELNELVELSEAAFRLKQLFEKIGTIN